jgi:hypothetical protein
MKSEPDWMNEYEFGYCTWLLQRRGYWMLLGEEQDCEVCPIRFCCWLYCRYEDPVDEESMDGLDMEPEWDDYYPEVGDIYPTREEYISSHVVGSFDDAAADFAFDSSRERKAKSWNVGGRRWR